MSQTMKLSAEEIALIEERRAEEQAKQNELLKSYDYYKGNKVHTEIERYINREKVSEEKKELYESLFNKLIHVSNDFRFDCNKIVEVIKIELFNIDEHGSEIRYSDIDGEREWLTPNEIVEIDTYSYTFKIVYTGTVPEGYEYYIQPIEQYSTSRWNNRIIGYKMLVRGTNIDSYSKKGQMTNPRNVHTKIIEIVANEFAQIEYKRLEVLKNKRIEDHFKIKFSKYVNNYSFENNIFTVKLDNGIVLEFQGYQNHLVDVVFSTPKVKFPYNKIDINNLLEGLDSVKVGE